MKFNLTFSRKKAIYVGIVLAIITGGLWCTYEYALFHSRNYFDSFTKIVKMRLQTNIKIGLMKLNNNTVSIENIAMNDILNTVISNIDVTFNINPLEKGLGSPRVIKIGRVYSRLPLGEISTATARFKSALNEASKDKQGSSTARGALSALASTHFIEQISVDHADIILTGDDNRDIIKISGISLKADRGKLQITTGPITYQNIPVIDASSGEIILAATNAAEYPFIFHVEKNSQTYHLKGELAKDFDMINIQTKFRTPDFIPYRNFIPMITSDASSFALALKISNLKQLDDLSIGAKLIARNIGISHSTLATSPVMFDKVKIISQSSVDKTFTKLSTKAKISLAKNAQNPADGSSSPEAEFATWVTLNLTPTSTFKGGAIALEIKLPPTGCQSILKALPDALSAQIKDFDLSGDASLHLTVNIPLDHMENFEYNLKESAFNCTVAHSPFAYSSARLNAPNPFNAAPVTPAAPNNDTSSSTTYAYLKEISPKLLGALVVNEDAGFYSHHGFQIQSILSAMRRNLKEHSVILGGSTITMQTAKNLFLSQDRTVARKVQELFLTWHLETILSKNKILELYANVIEYGPGVFGVKTAAHHFFNKTPAELTPLESAYMAGLLPSPKNRYIYYCQNRITANYRTMINSSLRRMYELGVISNHELRTSLSGRIYFAHNGGANTDPHCQNIDSPDKDNIASAGKSGQHIAIDQERDADSFRVEF